MTDAPSATVPATCLICMDELAQPMNGVPGKRRQKTEYKPEDCWRLRCGHFYCVGCLNGWVESKVNERNVPIICASLDCKREVRPPHVAAVLGTALFEKFSELVAVKAFEAESMYCPNKACSHVFVKPSFRVGEEKTACLFCKTKICLRCQVQWHDGLDCDQYKRMIAAGGDSDEAQLHKLKEQHKWKQCPKCNILVERSIGCNFMRCKCGEHFCYECGVPYAEKIPSAGHPHGKPGCQCGLFPPNPLGVGPHVDALRERLNQLREFPHGFHDLFQRMREDGNQRIAAIGNDLAHFRIQIEGAFRNRMPVVVPAPLPAMNDILHAPQMPWVPPPAPHPFMMAPVAPRVPVPVEIPGGRRARKRRAETVQPVVIAEPSRQRPSRKRKAQ
ncbi:hypothetical protein AC1031_015365 [Aphanomyces cochlioides]|nr:hypothetical protein AC1031_015365 [Aphanomyces cochlioides]